MKKLVRDKIPELTGQKATYASTAEEMLELLCEKLIEEAYEVRAAQRTTDDRKLVVDELADVFTVFSTLSKLLRVSNQELMQAVVEKAKAKGVFTSGAVMEFPDK